MMQESLISLAKWVLLTVAFLFFFSGAAILINPEQGQIIFDACKIILPPIVTFILGYYFSKTSKV